VTRIPSVDDHPGVRALLRTIVSGRTGRDPLLL